MNINELGQFFLPQSFGELRAAVFGCLLGMCLQHLSYVGSFAVLLAFVLGVYVSRLEDRENRKIAGFKTEPAHSTREIDLFTLIEADSRDASDRFSCRHQGLSGGKESE